MLIRNGRLGPPQGPKGASTAEQDRSIHLPYPPEKYAALCGRDGIKIDQRGRHGFESPSESCTPILLDEAASAPKEPMLPELLVPKRMQMPRNVAVEAHLIGSIPPALAQETLPPRTCSRAARRQLESVDLGRELRGKV